MATRERQSGLTLPEIAVVIATIALLMGLALPAVRMLVNSFESQGSTRSMISAALAAARGIAAEESKYAGVRFQRDSDGRQHMVFIVHDFGRTGLSDGFRVVEGVKPIELPDSVGIMDFAVRMNHGATDNDAKDTADEALREGHLDPANLDAAGNNIYMTDTCTFSIIFSPAGKLVRHEVRVRNRDGVFRPDNAVTGRVSMDDVFNSPVNIANGMGIFIQDDHAELGLGAESSRNRFLIYDKNKFGQLNTAGKFAYLKSLAFVYINSYTGRIISTD